MGRPALTTTGTRCGETLGTRHAQETMSAPAGANRRTPSRSAGSTRLQLARTHVHFAVNARVSRQIRVISNPSPRAGPPKARQSQLQAGTNSPSRLMPIPYGASTLSARQAVLATVRTANPSRRDTWQAHFRRVLVRSQEEQLRARQCLRRCWALCFFRRVGQSPCQFLGVVVLNAAPNTAVRCRVYAAAIGSAPALRRRRPHGKGVLRPRCHRR
jgi:hypothetical protein